MVKYRCTIESCWENDTSLFSIEEAVEHMLFHTVNDKNISSTFPYKCTCNAYFESYAAATAHSLDIKEPLGHKLYATEALCLSEFIKKKMVAVADESHDDSDHSIQQLNEIGYNADTELPMNTTQESTSEFSTLFTAVLARNPSISPPSSWILERRAQAFQFELPIYVETIHKACFSTKDEQITIESRLLLLPGEDARPGKAAAAKFYEEHFSTEQYKKEIKVERDTILCSRINILGKPQEKKKQAVNNLVDQYAEVGNCVIGDEVQPIEIELCEMSSTTARNMYTHMLQTTFFLATEPEKKSEKFFQHFLTQRIIGECPSKFSEEFFHSCEELNINQEYCLTWNQESHMYVHPAIWSEIKDCSSSYQRFYTIDRDFDGLVKVTNTKILDLKSGEHRNPQVQIHRRRCTDESCMYCYPEDK